MESALSSTAWRIAQHWAAGRDRSQLVIRGFARQVQDHLGHGADPEHLHRLAGWVSVVHGDCLDLDLAMRYPNAPRPEVLARSGHPCLCRGPAARGGAPAPAIVRQLIRRQHAA
jgi:hypothetical protein